MPRADPLQRYRTKRDFRVSAEPAGHARVRARAARGAESASDGPLAFVVQKHAARRLHYDFRLELDGTLKSWAVPKGPSLDPGVRRMAVHVEDHPLDYADFEGTIPPKQYGAGTVIVWDRGVWVPQGDAREAYRAGKIKFELRGEKLSGHWMLVRMHGHEDERQQPWLLIKERDASARSEDEYSIVEALPDSVLGDGAKGARRVTARNPATGTTRASATSTAHGARRPPAGASAGSHPGPPARAKPAALPEQLAPQLATLVDPAPETPGWTWEMKFDGYRILARVDGRKVRLFTRNGHDWTSRMASLADEVAALALPSGWLDGEIIVQGAHGAPDFQRLQNAFDEARTDDILYYLFDMPYCAGYDLRQVPLCERRALLKEWLDAHPSPRVRFSEDFAAAPKDLLRSACRLQMEGLIGKRIDSVYVSRRSPTWIKVKCKNRQEFVVGGFTDPQGSRHGLGSLLLGIHDESGALRYAGRVGSGFDDRTLRDLSARLQALHTGDSPFADRVREPRSHWVRPELVAEVSFTQWTTDGRIRHPVFHGLRSDKPQREITREKTASAAALESGASSAARDPSPADVKVSNPQRVIDPTTGITKLDLVRYYARVAHVMLPHLKQRPVALVRAPNGIDGQKFFQKHASETALPGVRSLDEKYDPGEAPLIEIATAKGLVTVAQMNTVELHTWNATTRAIEKPDRMIFDLDPGEGVKWPAMQEAAQLVHTLLDELELVSFLKTSGGKGLHVVVPLTPKHGWDLVKSLSKAIVVHLARTLPDRFVAKSGPANRKGRIFADYLRNGRGATTAAAWSARARPGIGVSVPVAWTELPGLAGADHWTLRNIEPRLQAATDPWADYAATRQTLDSAMRALEFVPPKA